MLCNNRLVVETYLNPRGIANMFSSSRPGERPADLARPLDALRDKERQIYSLFAICYWPVIGTIRHSPVALDRSGSPPRAVTKGG
jgi:hypothetical protein